MKKGISVALAGIILAVTAAVCIGGSLLITNAYKNDIAKEEAKLPESAISHYLQQIRSNDYDQAYEASQLIQPHYNSKEDYVAMLKEIYQDIDLNQVQYVAVQRENQEGLFYDIVFSNQQVATLNLIEKEGKWYANTLFTGDHEYSVEVASGTQFKVNDIEVRSEDCIEKNGSATNYAGLKKGYETPKVDRYLLSNLVAEPEIELESGMGMIKDVLSNTYYIGKKSTDTKLKETFISAAKALAQYPTKDGGLGTISQMSVTDSDFYNRLRTMDNQWYAAHNSATFSNMAVSDIIMQSEDSMIANVTFDYKITASSASKEYHCGYQITFIKVGSSWKIAGLGIDNDLK